ncbi:MAG: RHS repeat-associated core domain-containing protein [Candidatus Saccharicenans sp.]|nr:RHS repeat-associated core domain-containing protein [Candidatus Saccharicenans sp.]
MIRSTGHFTSDEVDGLKKGSGGSGELRTMSVGEIGIYYIYSYDGRLLAEYDGYGVCLRKYIYVGAKMVAEYQPATGKYYYYTTNQINSTRVVTDDNGNVVYAAVHDPYGGIHQTWANAFNPELKFSGKEQDAESGLYYFGARYYDPTLYL